MPASLSCAARVAALAPEGALPSARSSRNTLPLAAWHTTPRRPCPARAAGPQHHRREL